MPPSILLPPGRRQSRRDSHAARHEVNGFVHADPVSFLERTSKLLNPTEEALVEIRRLFARFEKYVPPSTTSLRSFA